MASLFYASDYAYGVNPDVQEARVISGPNTTGVGTIVVAKPTISIGSGPIATGRNVNIFNTNAPIIVGTGGAAETVTPTAVTTVFPSTNTQITATFTIAHGQGAIVSSGTVGLQEVINDIFARYGGGQVTVDSRWAFLGGTSAMLAAVSLPAGVQIVDLRGGGAGGAGTSLSANGAVAPGAGYYVITKAGTLAALTLAAPTAAQNGQQMIFTSRTAFAHTITATGLINNGTTGSPHNLATFAAFAGASLTLVADNLLWNVLSSNSVTIS